MNAERRVFQFSMIQEGSYDPEARTLEITFINGQTYQAEDVPQVVWDGLKQATSPGRHFRQAIRPLFNFRKS